MVFPLLTCNSCATGHESCGRRRAGHCPQTCPQGGLGRLSAEPEMGDQPCHISSITRNCRNSNSIPTEGAIASCAPWNMTSAQLSEKGNRSLHCKRLDLITHLEKSVVSSACCFRGKRNEDFNLSWRSCGIMRAVGFPVHVQKEHLLVCTSRGIHLYLTASLKRIRALMKQNIEVGISYP